MQFGIQYWINLVYSGWCLLRWLSYLMLGTLFRSPQWFKSHNTTSVNVVAETWRNWMVDGWPTRRVGHWLEVHEPAPPSAAAWCKSTTLTRCRQLNVGCHCWERQRKKKKENKVTGVVEWRSGATEANLRYIGGGWYEKTTSRRDLHGKKGRTKSQDLGWDEQWDTVKPCKWIPFFFPIKHGTKSPTKMHPQIIHSQPFLLWIGSKERSTPFNVNAQLFSSQFWNCLPFINVWTTWCDGGSDDNW